MNWFKLYIGDYQRDTAHLSITEHGAYLLMLQHYYATERPLPIGKALERMLRAETKAEREAIEAVTARFWTTTEAGLVNERADLEIEKADHQRTINREVGKRGGRPKQTESVTESVTETEPKGNPIQTPDTRQYIEPSALVGKASPSRPPDCPTQDLIDLYHSRLPMLPRVEVINDGRRRALSARWREVVTDPDIRKAENQRSAALEWFDWYFTHAGRSAFLTGKKSDWRADFDFLMTPSKFAKVVEGSYHKEHA